MPEFHLGEHFLDNWEVAELSKDQCLEAVKIVKQASDAIYDRQMAARKEPAGWTYEEACDLRYEQFNKVADALMQVLGPLDDKKALALLFGALDGRVDMSAVTIRRVKLTVQDRILRCFRLTEEEITQELSGGD
jgi:hypothetical protein